MRSSFTILLKLHTLRFRRTEHLEDSLQNGIQPIDLEDGQTSVSKEIPHHDRDRMDRVIRQDLKAIKPKVPSVIAPQDNTAADEQESKQDAIQSIKERIFLRQEFYTAIFLKCDDNTKEDS